MTRIAITGHRSNKLWGYNYNNANYIKLMKLFKQYIIDAINNDKEHKVEIITGMAIGTDTIFTVAGLYLRDHGYNIKVTCAIPFKGQESKWPLESQNLYNMILEKADNIVYVCNEGYAKWKMQKRNEYMINLLTSDNDFLIAVWNGTPGGTANCVGYAKKLNKRIIYINPNSLNN